MTRKPDLALGYFPHSTEDGVEVPKRKEFPKELRPGHIMVTGGREGPYISRKKVPPEGDKTNTGWRGEPSGQWKGELQAAQTLEDARTQPPFLRKVRPEQRAWARGVMRVEDIERVINGGLIRPVTLLGGKQAFPIDVKVKDNPRVELTVWIADESTFASITGTVSYLRQVVIGGSGNAEQDALADKILSKLGINEKNNTIANPREVVNSTAYADAMGLIFKPDPAASQLQPGSEVALPYYLIGRARRIFPVDNRPWRSASRPTEDANTPRDSTFVEYLDVLEREIKDEAIMAEVRRLTEPNRPYEREITPFTSVGPVGSADRISGMAFKTEDTLEGKPEVADPLSIMNLYRTAGAGFQSIMGKPTSVIEAPHDPLRISKQRTRRRKKAPKDNPPMFNNPRIGGRSYIQVTQADLDKMARTEGLTVEQLRVKYPHFITAAEAKAARAAQQQPLTQFTRPAYAYRRKANPASGYEVGDHLRSSDGEFNCVVRRMMDDGRVIIQAFNPDANGGRAKKYHPFKSVHSSQIAHLDLAEQGFADRMRELKARGQ